MSWSTTQELLGQQNLNAIFEFLKQLPKSVDNFQDGTQNMLNPGLGCSSPLKSFSFWKSTILLWNERHIFQRNDWIYILWSITFEAYNFVTFISNTQLIDALQINTDKGRIQQLWRLLEQVEVTNLQNFQDINFFQGQKDRAILWQVICDLSRKILWIWLRFNVIPLR